MSAVGRKRAESSDRFGRSAPKRRRRVVFRLLFVGFLLLAVAAVLFLVPRDPEPTPMLLTTVQYLNFAREVRADLDAPGAFTDALSRLDEAKEAMREQFRRPAFLRDYKETRRLLGLAHEQIARSVDEARTEVQGRETRLRTEIEEVRREITGVRSLLLNLPPESRVGLEHIVSAESRIWAAEAELSAQESLDALESMAEAREEIVHALDGIRMLLVEFMSRREGWIEDLEATIAETRQPGKIAIVVDKLNHKLHLVRNGRRYQSYDVELGPGWLEQKVREGDRATPEGRYRVTVKKQSGQTRYHKALLLDYPNDSDSARFERMRLDGQLPSYARVGGLIEIHGEGGKGEDWTMGCISLSNEDVDKLYAQVKVGDRVTIVGLWDEPGWLTGVLATTNR